MRIKQNVGLVKPNCKHTNGWFFSPSKKHPGAVIRSCKQCGFSITEVMNRDTTPMTHKTKEGDWQIPKHRKPK